MESLFTVADNLEPWLRRTYAAPKKDKKAKLNPFLIKRFKRNSKLKMIIIYFYRYHL